jgi:hypothetical protein
MAVVFLWPDVLALFHWIENAIPGRLEIKGRHVEHKHRIVLAPAPARVQELLPLLGVAYLWLRKLA